MHSEQKQLNADAVGKEVALAFHYGQLTASQPLDSFCTWLLAGVGASVAISIGTLTKLISVVGATGVSLFFVFVTLSVVSGVLQKIFALWLLSLRHVRSSIRENLLQIAESYGGGKLDNPLTIFEKLGNSEELTRSFYANYPKEYGDIEALVRKESTDWRKRISREIRMFRIQIVAAASQMGFAILALSVIAVSTCS